MNQLKKKNTYNFYLQLEERIHQVCKTFFLNTIDVSERRIYYFHNHLNDNATGCPITSNKGRNVKKVIPPAKIEGVVNHISSFPTIDSHYCRSSSERKYLDSNLTVAKMYSLYREITNDPVKEAIYRKQFKSFNISFYKPKKDQCDKCIIFKNCHNPSEAQITDHNVHQADKMAMKAERQLDRQNIEPKHAVICIDLQSVFALPKGNASAFYYKRKLNVYNMTATCIVVNKPKITYCAMWNEAHSGRSGDDIASSFIKILKQVVIDNAELEYITLWSDSCIAQNKNKILTTALLYFLQTSLNIRTIIQKFSTPGHSLIQEVDCVHSVIDRHLKHLEMFSPLSLLRQLKNMSYKNVTLKIMQMQKSDFSAYSIKCGSLNFAQVPFMKIKVLKFEKDDIFKLQFKTNARQEFQSITLKKLATKKTLPTAEDLFCQKINSIQNRNKSISKEKVADIKSLFAFMPQVDQEYYKVLLKIN